MIALLTALFTALTEALRIWAVNARYNLQQRIEADIEADEKTLSTLRASDDPASVLAGDRVRDRILRANGIIAALPAAGAPPQGGPASPNR
ncbi:MAG TPA: hypothetical protein VL357_05825 [Rariglobus sp.]|nr:hypothetical protein [Rariglobus sp.]